jgi:hypothetical protein
MILSIIFWLAIGYTIGTLTEWYIHKYHMHKNSGVKYLQPWMYEHHAVIHHPAFKNDFRISNPKEHNEIGIYLPTLQVLIPATPLLGLFGWVTGLWIGAICLWCMLAAHMILWSIIHRTMHSTEQKWFRRMKLYRYLATYHMMHHLYPNKNYNVVCPGADWLFGTYKSPSKKDWERIEKEI